MKKKHLCCLLFLLGICLSLHSFAGNLLEYQFSLGSGIPFYTATAQQTRSDYMAGTKQNRIILTADTSISLLLSKYIRFAAGVVTTQDYLFTDEKYANYIDYAIYGGFRIFPLLKGFNLGIDYAIGQRTDFFGGGNRTYQIQTPWGNGFRLLLEYDFHNGRQGLAPAICANWRRMPRGTQGADHYLTISIKLSYL